MHECNCSIFYLSAATIYLFLIAFTSIRFPLPLSLCLSSRVRRPLSSPHLPSLHFFLYFLSSPDCFAIGVAVSLLALQLICTPFSVVYIIYVNCLTYYPETTQVCSHRASAVASFQLLFAFRLGYLHRWSLYVCPIRLVLLFARLVRGG